MKLDAGQKQRRDEMVLAARQAEKDKRWLAAIMLWQQVLAAFPPRASWLSSYGKALAALGRFDEARRIYDDLSRTEPATPHGLVGLAQVAGAMLDYAGAVRHWDTVEATFPDEWRPAWQAKRANVLMKAGRVEEAEAAFKGLAASQPDDPVGLLGLAAAADLKRDKGTAAALWREIEARFPDDARAGVARIRHELKRGTTENAQRHFEDGTSVQGDDRPLIEADIAFQAFRYREALDVLAAARRSAANPSKFWAKGLTFRERSILSHKDAEDLVAAAAEAVAALPDDPTLRQALARALIVAGRDEEATRTIADLGSQLRETRDGLLLASWAAFRAGDLDGSVGFADEALNNGYVASIHGPEQKPKPVSPAIGGRAAPDIAVFTNVKNEADYLPWFLDYYRKLGIEHFYVTDDASGDGSREFLAAQSDVTLFDPPGDFFAAGGGMGWINHLIAEKRGRWSVYVDTDEMLVFPESETKAIAQWLAEVDASGQEAIPAFMLDMYDASLPIGETGVIADPLAATPCFDSGYFRFGSVQFPFYEVGGGPRARLFGTYEHLRKVPILRGPRPVRYLSSHVTTPARLGPHSALLLHFKLLRQARDAKPDQSRVASRSQGAIARHGRYEQMLGRGDLAFEGTRRYAGTQDHEMRSLFDLARAPLAN